MSAATTGHKVVVTAAGHEVTPSALAAFTEEPEFARGGWTYRDLGDAATPCTAGYWADVLAFILGPTFGVRIEEVVLS